MMYVPLLAQAAIIASFTLFSGPASIADSVKDPILVATGASTAPDKAKLRCRVYFGCAPIVAPTAAPLQD